MFKKLRSTAVLSLCIMIFSIVQPAFADYRTGSAEGDAVAYGAGAGTLAAIGAAAVLTFFTGGAALPLVLGVGAVGAAGGAYYGYKEDNKTIKKDLTVAGGALVGGGAIGGVGAAVVVLGGKAVATGGVALGGAALQNKPKNSPNINNWLNNGGTVTTNPSGNIWTYTDTSGKSVQYINDRVIFPAEAKHPVIKDISIGSFTGDRNLDKRLYLEQLKKLYGLNSIPDGYVVHHDTTDGVLQLVKEDYHKEFLHRGGHSLHK